MVKTETLHFKANRMGCFDNPTSSPLPSFFFPNKTLADPSRSARRLDRSGTAYFSRTLFQQNSPNQLCLKAIPVTEGGESTISLFVSAQLCFSSAFPKADRNQLWGTGFFAVGLGSSNSKCTRIYFYLFSGCKGLFLLFSL